MKIGYPCINLSIGCSSNRTFRLKSYSENRLVDTVTNNLHCLWKILKFNVFHNLLFFRITSDIVPFASHPICHFDWRTFFRSELAAIGEYIASHDIRISMHPGQYNVLNSPDNDIVNRSIKELKYHCDFLDALNLNAKAKIQIHVGGVYKEKDRSIMRFIKCYQNLEKSLKQRLVIENDERSYTVSDCINIHAETGVPVLFDVFHHNINNAGLTNSDALSKVIATWSNRDGVPMIDYSSFKGNGLKIGHTYSN